MPTVPADRPLTIKPPLPDYLLKLSFDSVVSGGSGIRISAFAAAFRGNPGRGPGIKRGRFIGLADGAGCVAPGAESARTKWSEGNVSSANIKR